MIYIRGEFLKIKIVSKSLNNNHSLTGACRQRQSNPHHHIFTMNKKKTNNINT